MSPGTRRQSKLADDNFLLSDSGPAEINHRKIPLHELCPNPDNPRYDDDPEVQEIAGSLQQVGQLQDAVVMARRDFVQLYPELADALEAKARWVTILGNRRLAAARLAGLTALHVRVARSWEDIESLEQAILHENLHRRGLPPLLEADRIKRQMTRTGMSARQIADSLKKSHTWVNSRLGLLDLIPPFRELLKEDRLGIKQAEKLSKMSPGEQEAALAGGPPFVDDGSSASTPPGASGNGQVVPPQDPPHKGAADAGGNSASTGSAAESDGDGSAKPGRVGIRVADASPAGFAEVIRQHLTPDQIEVLIGLLADRPA